MANVKTRIIQKHDSSANWAKATTFVPLKGEIIIYDDLGKVKIGDGVTKVNDLQFLDKDAIKQVKLNNVAKTPNTDGVVDLGTVITAHQDISGKQDKLSTAQLNAVNSRITSERVELYDGYSGTLTNMGNAIGEHNDRLTNLEAKPGLDKTGTVSSIKINGTSKTPTNGAVDLGTVITSHQDISGKQDKLNAAQLNAANSGITNAKVKQYDGYNSTIGDHTTRITSLEGKPGLDKVGTITSINNQQPDSKGNIALNIPSPVSEATVSGWGFTKNTGTYSKPSGGIPKTDLASAVQTSLTNADNAVKKVKINGVEKSPTNGVVDLGTVITAHQDISGKVNTSTTIAGKALTDNISASALRTALNVEDGANKIIVDENFNEDSPNPVQNKTITKMFSNFIGVELIGPNNTSVETDLMHLNRVVNIDESIYTQLRNLHHLYMTNGAPCNIYIYLSDRIFAFAGANNSVFDFIMLYDKGINEADIYLLRIFDNNTAVITSVQNQFDSKYAAQSALANYVSRNSSETINGTKTFAEDVIFNNTLKGQGDTAYIKLDSSVGQDATTLEIYPDGTFGFLFANGDMGDYFKLPSINNPDYDKNDPYILATTYDIQGTYEVFKRTNMTSTSYSTNWTIKSNTTLPEGAKLVMQISSGPYNTSADNMVNKSVFIWNIPINWNNNQTTENFQTETTTSSYNGSISIDGGVSISFSIYQGKTDIIVKGRNTNSTPGKVEFWTYK